MEQPSNPKPENEIVLKFSKKQEIAWELLNDNATTELVYGGSGGGGKTALVSLWMVLECVNNPGIKIALGREELLRLKQTTLATIIGFAHKALGVEAADFNFNGSTNTLTYQNGSLIQLLHMAYSPQDPNYDTLGSLDFTHVVIEEAGEVREKAKAVLGSRRNRWKNEEYGITGKLVMTCNPSKNFLYSSYYLPYRELGAGDFQRWEKGQIFYEDAWHPAFHAFVKALVTDNPFISKNYIETLRELPSTERKRLLEGDWEFDKNTDGMFDDTVMRKGIFNGVVPNPGENPLVHIGVDVADTGKDSTIATVAQNGIAIRQVRFVVDRASPTSISDQQAEQLIALATQYGLSPFQAMNIAIEINGVGVGIRDAMIRAGWNCAQYQANGTSRSQGFYDLMVDMRDGTFKIAIDAMQYKTELLRQLNIYEVTMDTQLKPKVTAKEKIKDIIGHSPDESDSMMIVNWVRRGGGIAKSKINYDYSKLGYLVR